MSKPLVDYDANPELRDKIIAAVFKDLSPTDLDEEPHADNLTEYVTNAERLLEAMFE